MLVWVSILLLMLLITGVLLSGTGSWLVSGFNTMPREEQDKYDKEKISKDAGKICAIIDIAMIIHIYMIKTGKATKEHVLYFVAFIIIVIIIGNIGSIEKYKKE